ncbi:MAG: hypothetical protein ACXABY_24940, partial [Candidatus Thorarchaeota archaeon]
MSMLRSAMQALDLQNAGAWARMGLRDKQVFDVFGAYFRGAELPRAGAAAGMDALAGLQSNFGVGAMRSGLFAFGAVGAWNMLPRSNALAIPGGLGAGAGAAYMAGQTPMGRAGGAGSF